MRKSKGPILKALIYRFFILFMITFPLYSKVKTPAIWDFSYSKKMLRTFYLTQKDLSYDLYCHCPFKGKKIDVISCGYLSPKGHNSKLSKNIEWEHVVPASNFGQSFKEWREGAAKCQTKSKKYKGRRCAKTNLEYRKMEGDPYNLWPVVGEVNRLRGNLNFSDIEKTEVSLGACGFKKLGRKVSPPDLNKGIVARVYLYMDQAYGGHGVLGNQSAPLFMAWDKKYPVSEVECSRYQYILQKTKIDNPILKNACLLKGKIKGK